MKKYFLLIIILSVFFASGCARTVTSKATGNQIVFNITFNGNVDATTNKYYIVLATIPTVVPYPNEYYLAPGENYDQNKFTTGKDLSYYYNNYFSTWMDFVTLQNNTFYITNGNFTTAEAHSSYLAKRVFVSSKDPTASSQLTFTLFFTYLSQTPEKIYYNILCVDANGYLKDRLDQADNSFYTTTGTVVTMSDPADPNIDPSLDVLSSQVAVQ